ncbi:MAG: S8 family serine peptidase [Propionibacteriaceae bacterium]|nr:S8 family serine peptidase [Propionibacteriaceae bacterium]
MTRLRPTLLALALVWATLTLVPPPASAEAPADRSIPTFSIMDDVSGAAAGTSTYIVQYRPGTDVASGASALEAAGVQVAQELTHVFDGAIVHATDEAADQLRRSPLVAAVEADRRVRLSDVQTDPTWGLDRIDQRWLPLDGTYTYPGTASGVTAYVIDSGIIWHQELDGRLPRAAGIGGIAQDCHGHGTHVAGTLGGRSVGVAKEVDVVAIRVLDCDGEGPMSATISAIDWAIKDNLAHPGPAVANLSLGGDSYYLMDEAIDALVDAGITAVVAAGNEADNACAYSPAAAASAVTVANATSSDAQAPTSNHGPCVDLYAPGTYVSSASIHEPQGYTYALMSGTSMASPHVAGVAAILQGAHPSWTPARVGAELIGTATRGAISNPSPGTPNLLLYSDPQAPVPTPSPTPDPTPTPPPPLIRVTPTAPTFTDVCGAAFDTVTIPRTTGVDYLLSGTVAPAGTWKASGTLPVTARAQAGYALQGATAWTWTFTNRSAFTDVTPTTQFFDEMCWMAINQISTGHPDGSYRPLDPVNRDAMAAFLYRLAGSPTWTPPRRSPFTDVTPSTQFYAEITWLAEEGITTGYPDGTYRPLDPVNRDAMAAFLYRLAEKPAWSPPKTSPFNDVTPSTQFYAEITWLADRGITTGYPDGGYRPVTPVNRDAMAAFLHRLKAVEELV